MHERIFLVIPFQIESEIPHFLIVEYRLCELHKKLVFEPPFTLFHQFVGSTDYQIHLAMPD